MLTTINPANLALTPEQWTALGPYLILAAGSMFSMLIGTVPALGGRHNKRPLFLFSLFVMLFSGVWGAAHWVREPMTLFAGMMQLDYFSSLFNVMLPAAAALVMMGCYSYLENEDIHYAEFYPIILVATLGMMLLASTVELLSIFTALELMSLSVYVLVGMRRNDALSNEASIKYFVMGGVASAIYLYGTALMYGALNTTKLAHISMLLSKDGVQYLHNPVLAAGLVLLLVGFLFKVAVVPFHMWTPDVYEGAPTLITGYMATALKASVFAAFIRVSVSVLGDQGVSHLGDLSVVMHDIIWWLALLTMVIGNFVALMQSNLKRMLAYSAIAHTGYLLVGLLAGPKVGYSSLILYLVAYIAMNIGAFGILGLFSSGRDRSLDIENMKGLSERHPWAAASLTVFLLSLGGIPPTAGFMGKYYMFSAALEAGEVWLVLLAVLTSAVSIYYYLRIVVFMYMRESAGAQAKKVPSKFAYAAIAICLVLVINFGMFPAQILHAVKKASIF